MQCGRCRYWSRLAAGGAPIPDPRLGECRRWPPVIAGQGVRGVWPHTTSEDWCGDFSETGREEA